MDISQGNNFERSITFKRIRASILGINNQNIPLWVTVYIIRPLEDSGRDPVQRIQDSCEDMGNELNSDWSTVTSTTINPNTPKFNFSDYKQLRNSWKIVKKAKIQLRPGQSFKFSHTVKNVRYNSEYLETHTQTYQKSLKAFTFLFKLEGPIAHLCPDTGGAVIDEYTTQAGQLDVRMQRSWDITYDGAGDFTAYGVYNGANTVDLGEIPITAIPDNAQLNTQALCP